MMFNFLIEDNDLEQEFQKYGLDKEDINFIVEQIAGPKERTNGVRIILVQILCYATNFKTI